MPINLTDLGLNFNPFEPAASGAPVSDTLWLPDRWQERIRDRLDSVSQGQGVKALAIAGEYGSGKTYMLQWLHRIKFPAMRVKSFYFDNPGVQFYDLANSLLRQIGRKDFAKSLWELVAPYVTGYQRSLFDQGFEEYLTGKRNTSSRENVLSALQEATIAADITQDEEIAHRLALIAAEAPTKPYFEYRDFVAGKQNALVAENEEAKYFGAILKLLRISGGIESVAFLIDEFEEVSYQKLLTRREAQDYLATLKKLLNLTHDDNLWLIIAMTPDAKEKTEMLDPALWERFTGGQTYVETVEPLTNEEASGLIEHRINSARIAGFNLPCSVFPFPDDFIASLKPSTYSNPRRLVKVCFHCISCLDSTSIITKKYAQKIEQKIYPDIKSGAAL